MTERRKVAEVPLTNAITIERGNTIAVLTVYLPGFATWEAVVNGGDGDAAFRGFLADAVRGPEDEVLPEEVIDQLAPVDAIELLTIMDAFVVPSSIGEKTEGDGVSQSLVVPLADPFDFGTTHVSHIEFTARTYGEMKGILKARGRTERLRAALKDMGNVASSKGIPMGDKLISMISARDAAFMAEEVMGKYFRPSGASRRL